MPTGTRSLTNHVTEDMTSTTAIPNSSMPSSRSRRAGAGGVTLSRLGRALVVAVLACLASVWGPAGPAAACTCKVATTADHVRLADVVFVGRLVERTVTEDVTWNAFTVDRPVKGPATERVVVLGPETDMCGLDLRGSGPFVVFASEREGHLRTYGCSGTGPLRPEVAADLDELVAPAPVTSQAAAGPVPARDGGTPIPVLALVGGGAVLVTAAGALAVVRRRR